MQHETHITADQGAGTKLIALVVVLAVLGGFVAYIVYGSGMW